MYSFANRNDTVAMDEPFYGYYLKQAKRKHPGHQEIINSMECDWNSVIDLIQKKSESADVLFVKNMAHHLLEDDLSYLINWTNVLLIRDPKQLISSFHEVIPNPTMEDVGIKRQWELYRELENVMVLDSNEVLKDPQKVLSKLCWLIDIPFSDEMLSWKSGAINADGVWAKHWYKNVHESTGFSKQKTSQRELPSSCAELYNEALPYYQTLYSNSIKA
ncbi:MAG: sulfotransferase family protein [Flavobacteriales bacterium]|nr:sulfotransferase family protein [Flavobacteriales bacterium]